MFSRLPAAITLTAIACVFVSSTIEAAPTQIRWATEYRDAINVTGPENALGAPDGRDAVLGQGGARKPADLTLSGFSAATKVDGRQLVDTLGITKAALSGPGILAFEAQSVGNKLGFESSAWDVTSALAAGSYVHNQSAGYGAGAIGGTISGSQFNGLFGTAVHWDVAWMFIGLGKTDLDSLSVRISSRGGWGSNPDLLGVGVLDSDPVHMPEPTSAALAAFGGIALLYGRRRRARKA